MLYIVVPVVIAQVLRKVLLARGRTRALRGVLARLGPLSLVALLATLVLLFGFQGEQILRAAARDRAAGRTDPDSGLFQLRARVPSEPRRVVRRIAWLGPPR